MLMGERHGEDRRLPARRPGPHGHGQQIETRVVYPDDGSPFLSGFFSSAGQRSCHHAWIAVSSRWVARARGRWTLCRTACKSRRTCAGWYFTPEVRRMTSATRWPVQIGPRNPYASAPASKSAGIGASWSAVSRGCRPGAGWRRSPATPRSRLSHWLTAPGVTPSAAAISCCFQPCCFSSQARRRRPSRQSSWAVLVLMPPA